ncbi:heterokaryon incompatibility protein-domain-containing protein [Xylariaceae sp. FL0255]|nr:heterokaryon incompatibility protein-domain-containing protein [Xylariaceae sp. FL0255]
MGSQVSTPTFEGGGHNEYDIDSQPDNLCKICRENLLENHENWEVGFTGFERDIEEMKISASTGCPTCAIFSSDLSLIRGYDFFDSTARIFVATNPLFFYPSSMDLTCGMSATPLRYLLKAPREIEHLIRHVSIEPNTESESCFNQGRDWLKTCLETHSCHPKSSDFTPTRLLEISTDEETLRLLEGTAVPQDVKYTTLSHCWGQKTPFQLTKDTIGAMSNATSTQSLNKTFRDAVKVTLKLGMNHIWIDCLCIIQDSTEDWIAESNRMHEVYGKSTCTIAATSAADSNGGCFQARNVDALASVKLVSRWGMFGTEGMYLTSAGLWWDRFQREPLNCRAWVVQERFLSPCVLHYDRDQIAWECRQLTACERFPMGMQGLITAHTSFFRRDLDTILKKSLQMDSIPGWALKEIWRPTIQRYTSTGITKPSDRLIAIRGVGLNIENVFGWNYVAGIFLMKDTPSQLVWKPMGSGHAQFPATPPYNHSKPTRPERTIAPSWSWASIDGPINMMPQWDAVENQQRERAISAEELRESALCKVLGIQSGGSPAEKAGLISQARLQLSCFMVQIHFADNEINRQNLAHIRGRLDSGGQEASFTVKTQTVADEKSEVISSIKTTLGLDNEVSDSPTTKFISTVGEQLAASRLDGTFEVNIGWDIWSEFDSENLGSWEKSFYLVPVYTVVQTKPTHIFGKSDYISIDGLIVQRVVTETEAAEGPTTCTFRRMGTFSVQENYVRFWAYLFQSPSFIPVGGGVDLVRGVDLLPDGFRDGNGMGKEASGSWSGVLQYRITLV